MLISDFCQIGNKLLSIRKRSGMTQAEVAEKAGLADRTYADIERGTSNMRVETLVRICEALQTTPDEIFLAEPQNRVEEAESLEERLHACTPSQRRTALALIQVYLDSLK